MEGKATLRQRLQGGLARTQAAHLRIFQIQGFVQSHTGISVIEAQARKNLLRSRLARVRSRA
jgi:hypothetical protein